MVFYLRGLLHNWKIPFCYYVSSGPVKSSVLKDLIVTVISELINISLNPMILICDQGNNNRSAFKELGATQESPIIIINNKKIFTCFDPPHLLKSLRNNFMNPRLNFLIRGKPVSWNDIVETYAIDRKSETSRALTKITPIHLNPNTFQKMRVKLAANIFSHSVASAVRTVCKSRELKSCSANNTADFVETINNIFDSLNSRVLKDPNPHRRPLSVFANSTSLKTLNDGLEYFKDIEVYSNESGDEENKKKNQKGDEEKKKRNNIYCIGGFIWSIRSILLLWDDLKKEGVKYLLTGFINQDALENFFSVIRNRGGYNPMPSVRQFRISMQHNMFIRLQTGVESANCQDDEAETLDVNEQSLLVDETQSDEEFIENEMSEIDISQPSTSELVQQIKLNNADLTIPPVLSNCENLESGSTVYLAGYIAFKLLKKYNCKTCIENIVKPNEKISSKNEFYLLSKDYGAEEITHLKRPTDCFVQFVYKLLTLFNSLFSKYKCRLFVVKNITNDLISQTEMDFKKFCKEHTKYGMNLLIMLKIYRSLKNVSEDMESKRLNSSEVRKDNKKLRILTN